MAEELSPEIQYVQVSIELLGRIKSKLIFDIFVQRSNDKFSKIIAKGDDIHWDRIEQYTKKGIEHFFITETDYEAYNRFIQAMGKKLLGNNSKATTAEASLVLKELTQSTLRGIKSSVEISPEQIDNAQLVVDSCIANLEKSPKHMMRIINAMMGYDYIYRHAVMTSIFSVLLAKEDGVGMQKTLSAIGLGAFLHNIGMCQLSFNPEEKTNLTGEERKEMMRHPEFGKRMLDGVKGIRDEVLFIVMQHHEQPNGQGYPNGIRGEMIYRPARIVSIADSFSALISDRPFREKMSPSEALKTMKSDIGKFDKKLLDKFTKMIIK